MSSPDYSTRPPPELDQAATGGPPPGFTTRGDAVSESGQLTNVSSRVGRYHILGALAAGGMGVVYRAHDPSFGRDIAVKTLHARLRADPLAVRRFLEEARITGQLQHPGIPAVFEIGELEDGSPFLAMKLVNGHTLAELLAADPPDRGRLIAAFEQVCQALAYAHSRGVIHRDLKPANVMVGAFGEVQVMDWGLAKTLGGPAGTADDAISGSTMFRDPRGRSDGAATLAGSVLGTPAYMPPEQAVGAIDRIDQRSDVFGLGAMLCAILTSEPPFVAATAEAARLLAARGELEGAFARLDGCAADPGLISLCKRCLAPDREERPADAAEVARTVGELRAAADERARWAELARARAEARVEQGLRMVFL